MQLEQKQDSDDPFARLSTSDHRVKAAIHAAHHLMLPLFATAGSARSEVIPRGISIALNRHYQELHMAGA
jgi:hypothetical protein